MAFLKKKQNNNCYIHLIYYISAAWSYQHKLYRMNFHQLLTHLVPWAAYYIKSKGEWVHQGVDLDVCDELLIIT